MSPAPFGSVVRTLSSSSRASRSSRTQATFNPALPAGVIRRLKADPEGLKDPNPAAPPLPRWLMLSAFFLAVGVGGLPLMQSPGPWNVAVLIPLFLVPTVLTSIAVHWKWRKEDRRHGIKVDWGSILFMGLLFLTSYFFGFVLIVWIIVEAGVAEQADALTAPGTPGAALLWFLPWATLAAVLACLRPWAARDLAGRHRDDYIIREQFAFTSSDRLLDTLQRVTARAEHAHRVLGDPAGLDHALPLLRSEEWRLARECLHLDRLQCDLDLSQQAADTERLREALAPQWKVFDKAVAALEEEVSRLDAYGEQIQAAVDTHEEWVKLQRIADRSGEFTDLAARAPAADPGTRDELRNSLHGAEAARAVREEMIQETARVTSDLFSDAEDSGSAPESGSSSS